MPRAVRLTLLAAGLAVAAAVLAGIAGAAWTSGVSAGPMTVATGHIAAPSGLSVSQASCSFLSRFTIKFSWTAASPTTGVSGYEIAYSSDDGSTWTNQYGPVTPAGTTTFTSPNRTDWSKTYLFRVSSLGPGNWTAPSASVSYTTPNAFCFGRTQALNSLLVTDTTTTDTTTTDTTTTDTQTTPTQTTETTTTESQSSDPSSDTETTSTGSDG
jgi:hypothetical protein